MKKSVLIAGASIAGLTMAYWMERQDYQVTVVEIGVAPRMGGSPVDVRGNALDTAKRMGILEALKRTKLQTMGLEFMNSKNELQGTMLVEDIGSLRPGDDIEIRRDDLVNILYENIKDGVEFKFSNRLKTLYECNENVTVTFNDGTEGVYDLVIGADGIHSGVRKLVFGAEEQFANFLNFYFSTFKVSDGLGKKNYGQAYNTPKNLAVIYHYNHDFADGFLTFRANKQLRYNRHDVEEQKQIVITAFEGVGWKVPQMIEELKKPDSNFYLDQGCQIKMPNWTKGRVALIGDAAYAPAFPTGMGVTLAMLGATTLADALAENADYKTAFDQYETTYRPTVDALQSTVYDGIAFLLPETEEAIDARNKVIV